MIATAIPRRITEKRSRSWFPGAGWAGQGAGPGAGGPGAAGPGAAHAAWEAGRGGGQNDGVLIDTEYGPAAVELDAPPRAGGGRVPGRPRFLMVLTHGAGGGVDSADLLAARDAAAGLGGAVARVVQPYRVRGARAPGSALRQDAAWLEVIARLRDEAGGVPLVQGGRSNGARVACRTARAAGALGVLALAFPLHPPGKPERSRVAELRGAGTSVLVINGSRDPFGVPADGEAARVVVLAGETHALSGGAALITKEVGGWLRGLLGGG
jgi:predicted alpha/beta-hydrolase family hydrolase